MLALEDLGDVTLQAHLGAAPPGRPRRALPAGRRASSPSMQRRGQDLASPHYAPYRVAFDVEKLTWEMDFFIKHFLEAYRGAQIPTRERAGPARGARAHRRGARRGAARAVPPRLPQPQPDAARRAGSTSSTSRTRGWAPTPTTSRRCCATRTSTSSERAVEDLIAYFLALERRGGARSGSSGMRFDLMALQRNLKALGTFGYQTATRRNPVYIQYIPRTLALRRGQPDAVPALRPAARTAVEARSRSCGELQIARFAAQPGGLDHAPCDFGLSTHLFHDERLAREHLEGSRRMGSDASSCSRRGPTSTTTTRRPSSAGGLARRDGPAPAQRARAHRRGLRERRLGRRPLDRGHRRRPGARTREREPRALALAATSRTSPRRARRACRTRSRPPASDNQPRRRPPQPRAICTGASARGVQLALEVIPNRLSTVDALVALIEDARAGDAGICLDFGHAFLMGDLVDAIEAASGTLVTTHVHDNGGQQRRPPGRPSRAHRLGHACCSPRRRSATRACGCWSWPTRRTPGRVLRKRSAPASASSDILALLNDSEDTVQTYIQDIAAHEGQTVTIKGWLHNRRSSGKIHFLILRDGTGFIQAVMSKAAVGEEAFKQADHLGQESARHRHGHGARRRAGARRLRDRRAAPSTWSPRRWTTRSRRRSTASTSCWTAGTSGSARRGSTRSCACGTR